METDPKFRELLDSLKTELKNHMDFCKESKLKDAVVIKLQEKYPYRFGGRTPITILHIIHNRLRRGYVRPHLQTVEKEKEYIVENQFFYDQIKKHLESKGLEFSIYEDVYNVK